MEPTISPVPDLLYEAQREARVQEITHLLEHPEQIRPEQALHRITVFITYKCNLACPYCKTIARSPQALKARPQKAQSFSLESFVEMLRAHGETPIKHLHLTGGEAALHPLLPRMVEAAKAHGVGRVSLTSNGARSASVYLALIEAGLDELRISVDAADPATGRLLTLRTSAWERSIRTLHALQQARESQRFFLIANCVVSEANRAQLPRIVRMLMELGVDDIKLITEVDQRDSLGDFPARPQVEAALRALLADAPAHRYALLRKKLKTVFAPDAVGLSQLPSQAPLRCYIPLTERTVDRVYYYPCSVYLREGGEPLGALSEPQSAQRARSARFVATHDCLQDEICQRYCLHCTKAYNQRANEVRRGD